MKENSEETRINWHKRAKYRYWLFLKSILAFACKSRENRVKIKYILTAEKKEI